MGVQACRLPALKPSKPSKRSKPLKTLKPLKRCERPLVALVLVPEARHLCCPNAGIQTKGQHSLSTKRPEMGVGGTRALAHSIIYIYMYTYSMNNMVYM